MPVVHTAAFDTLRLPKAIRAISHGRGARKQRTAARRTGEKLAPVGRSIFAGSWSMLLPRTLNGTDCSQPEVLPAAMPVSKQKAARTIRGRAMRRDGSFASVASGVRGRP